MNMELLFWCSVTVKLHTQAFSDCLWRRKLIHKYCDCWLIKRSKLDSRPVYCLQLYGTFCNSHCLKIKMNGKKLSRFQFNFPWLLGTSTMSKQEKFLSMNGLRRYFHLFIWLSRWTEPFKSQKLHFSL